MQAKIIIKIIMKANINMIVILFLMAQNFLGKRITTPVNQVILAEYTPTCDLVVRKALSTVFRDGLRFLCQKGGEEFEEKFKRPSNQRGGLLYALRNNMSKSNWRVVDVIENNKDFLYKVFKEKNCVEAMEFFKKYARDQC